MPEESQEFADEYEMAEARYAVIMNWLDAQSEISQKQTEQFIEIALEDGDKILGGKSLVALLERPDLPPAQFDLVKHNLWRFGEWTKKVITKEELRRRLEKEELTLSLIHI